MTEQEWLTGTDYASLFHLAAAAGRHRQCRLCAVAWAQLILRDAAADPSERMRQYRSLFSPSLWRPQLAAAESFADGRIDGGGLRAARQVSGGPYNIFLAPCRVTGFTSRDVVERMTWFRREFARPAEGYLCAVLRDIFRNPFRPVIFDPAWRTADTVAVAQTIYDARAFADLPVLGDALGEAGWTNDEVLAHCRGGGLHVRGCWVVDLVLGKG